MICRIFSVSFPPQQFGIVFCTIKAVYAYLSPFDIVVDACMYKHNHKYIRAHKLLYKHALHPVKPVTI